MHQRTRESLTFFPISPASVRNDHRPWLKKLEDHVCEELLSSEQPNAGRVSDEENADSQRNGVTTRMEHLGASGLAPANVAPLATDAHLSEEETSGTWNLDMPGVRTMGSDAQLSHKYQALRSPRAANGDPRTLQGIEQTRMGRMGTPKFNTTTSPYNSDSLVHNSDCINTINDSYLRFTPGTQGMDSSRTSSEPASAKHIAALSKPMEVAATKECAPEPRIGSNESPCPASGLKRSQRDPSSSPHKIRRGYPGSDTQAVRQTRSTSKRARLAQK